MPSSLDLRLEILTFIWLLSTLPSPNLHLTFTGPSSDLPPTLTNVYLPLPEICMVVGGWVDHWSGLYLVDPVDQQNTDPISGSSLRIINFARPNREWEMTLSLTIFFQEDYKKIEDNVSFDITQIRIRNHEKVSQNITILIKYVVDFLEYQNNIRSLSENIAFTVSDFVTNSKANLQRANIVPLLFLIFLGNTSMSRPISGYCQALAPSPLPPNPKTQK